MYRLKDEIEGTCGDFALKEAHHPIAINPAVGASDDSGLVPGHDGNDKLGACGFRATAS